MSRIFLSHSSADAWHAIALKKWLKKQRPQLANEIFLDIDEDTGLEVGKMWKTQLFEQNSRCEAVICLHSQSWESSAECRTEYRTAEGMGKQIVVARLEMSGDTYITSAWQRCDLFDDGPRTAIDVPGGPPIAFNTRALLQLRKAIEGSGVAPENFVWPPDEDKKRAPYRGWDPYEAIDAGVFYGRNAAIVLGLDKLRTVRMSGVKSLFVILGPSGSGKSSYLRAGLMPRLRRDDRDYAVLDVVRPERDDVLTGANGLAQSIFNTRDRLNIGRMNLANIKASLNSTDRVKEHLREIQEAAVRRLGETPSGDESADGQNGEVPISATPPTLVLPVDQAEELFGVDAKDEASRFLTLIGELARTDVADRIPLIVLITIRTDHHEALQTAEQLSGVREEVFADLKPMPQAEFKEVILGPARRATESGHKLLVEDPLVERLLKDCRSGADTLPLLSLTLARLYSEYGGDGDLKLTEYEEMGTMRYVVQREVDSILRDESKRDEQLELLRRAFIPRLATINPDNDQFVRRVARWDDLPAEAYPLLNRFVEKRLLVKDSRESGDVVEVALESLLQHWDALKKWLEDARENLKKAEILKRDAAAWDRHGRNKDWLLTGMRLADVEELLKSGVEVDISSMKEFIEESRKQNRRLRRRSTGLRAAIALAVVVAVVAAFALWALRATVLQSTASRLVSEAEQMLEGGRGGGDVRALQQLLAADDMGAAAATGVANRRRDELRIIENPPPPDNPAGVTAVRGIAVNTGGTLIAAANDDYTIRIWDRKGGQLPHDTIKLQPNEHPWSVAMSRVDGWIAAGLGNGTVNVWDANGQQQGQPIHGGAGRINSVAFSNHGDLIAAGSADGNLTIWDRAGIQQPVSMPAADRVGVRSVAFSPDDRVVATGADDGTVRLWDAHNHQSLTPPSSQDTQRTQVSSVAFNNDGNRLAIGRADGTLEVLEVLDGTRLASLGRPIQADHDAVYSVAFNRDGDRLVSGGADNTVRVWNVADPRVPKEIGHPLIGHHAAVDSVAFNEEGTEIISGGQDGSVRVWDAVAGLPILADQDEVRAVAFSPNDNGARMASGGSDGTVKIWDRATARLLRPPLGDKATGNDKTINTMAFSPDGTMIVTGSNDRSVTLWNVQTGVPKVLLPPVNVPHWTQRIWSVAFSPDGKKLAAGSWDNRLRLWATDQLDKQPQVASPPYQVRAVSFSPDNQHLVTGSLKSASGENSNILQRWTLDPLATAGDPMKSDPNTDLYGVAYNYDPRQPRVVSGTVDGTVRLWNPDNGQLLGQISGDQNPVTSVAFSHDNKWIVTGGGDGKIRFWGAGGALEPIGTPIDGHDSWVYSVAVSPDSKWILSGSGDRTIHLWSYPQNLAEFVCDRVGGNMSDQQWKDWVSKGQSWWMRPQRPCKG